MIKGSLLMSIPLECVFQWKIEATDDRCLYVIGWKQCW